MYHISCTDCGYSFCLTDHDVKSNVLYDTKSPCPHCLKNNKDITHVTSTNTDKTILDCD
jgi:hypothetical protein